MLMDIMKFWDERPEDTLYVGDMASDLQAAANAGCDFMWAHEFFPRELSEEDEKFIGEKLTQIAQLMQGTSKVCLHCGHTIQAMEKIGRSVYARPCGCRLWQGNVPEAWRTGK
jgi:hypothetical protein